MFTNPCEWHHLVLGSCSQTGRERSSTERSIQIQALSSHSPASRPGHQQRKICQIPPPPNTNPTPPPIISAPSPCSWKLGYIILSVHISIMPLKSPSGYEAQRGLGQRQKNSTECVLKNNNMHTGITEHSLKDMSLKHLEHANRM